MMTSIGLCLINRLLRITAPETTIIPRSPKDAERMNSITSLQPLCPRLRFNSKGHLSETGEVVRRASAITWEKMRKKQSRKFSFGILDHSLQTLDAIRAITKAKNRL
jgi:hypothetical protein